MLLHVYVLAYSSEIVTATVILLDNPSSISQVFYNVSSNSNTSTSAGVKDDKIRSALEEANKSK
jgi:hypothetical protein